MHLALANHPGQGDPQFRRTHRAGDRHQHLATGSQVSLVGAGRIQRLTGIEMTELVFHEGRNRHSSLTAHCGGHPEMRKRTTATQHDFSNVGRGS